MNQRETDRAQVIKAGDSPGGDVCFRALLVSRRARRQWQSENRCYSNTRIAAVRSRVCGRSNGTMHWPVRRGIPRGCSWRGKKYAVPSVRWRIEPGGAHVPGWRRFSSIAENVAEGPNVAGIHDLVDELAAAPEQPA